MKLFSIKAVAFLSTAVLATGIASANIVPTFSSVSTLSPGVFLYTYTASLDNQQQEVGGSTKLCFSDIQGLLTAGAATTASGWSAGTPTNSAGCAFNSGVSLPNVAGSVTYSYSGPTVVGGPTVLGTFSFESSLGTVVANNVAFGAQAQKSQGTSAGTPTANQGEVSGPGNPVGTPEPASMALLGSGLLLFAKFGNRFRNRKA